MPLQNAIQSLLFTAVRRDRERVCAGCDTGEKPVKLRISLRSDFFHSFFVFSPTNDSHKKIVKSLEITWIH
jgi:hypothetical protein